MNIRKYAAVALVITSLGFNGCALFLIGAGAAGGYAVSRDSVKSDFDLPMDQVFQASLAVANQMGHVNEQDSVHGLIRANISDVRVTITIKQLTKSTVELKVTARSIMPKVAVAQEVYNKISERLR